MAPSGKSYYIGDSDWNDFDDGGISVDGDSTTTGKFSGSGWIQTAPASPYYFLNHGTVNTIPYGAMLANTVTPDGYAVNESGEWTN